MAKWMVDRGIEVAFGIVGGGNVSLWDAVTRLGKTRLVCTHHEQAAVMASAYFNRTRGRCASVALVTTGAGSGNSITGVLAAHMDYIPLIVISGNEAASAMNSSCRVWGVQGYASSETVLLITKCAKRAMWPAQLATTLDDMLDKATAAPHGPVWLDIPKDVQSAEI